MAKYLLIIFSFFLTACAGISVVSQRDQRVLLDEYTTFNWLPAASDEFTNKDLLRIIQSQALREMILKGYAYKPESPEILVNVETITENKPVPENASRSGYSYWQGYDSMQRHNPGDVVFEFVDVAREQVIWQGAIQKGLAASHKEEKIGMIVRELFSQLNN